MGGKKSVVCTKARSLPMRYTPASSPVAVPTSTLRSFSVGTWRNTSVNSLRLSLEAQPAQEDSPVSFRTSVAMRNHHPLGPLLETSGKVGGQDRNPIPPAFVAFGHADPLRKH